MTTPISSACARATHEAPADAGAGRARGPAAMASTAAIDIAVCDVGDESWDRFVTGTPTATVFHRMAWRRMLEETWGYRAHYLAARRGADVVGVLPLFALGSRRRPRCLLSLPFAVDGGVCAVDDEVQQALACAALELAAELRAGRIELRDRWQAPGFAPAGSSSLRYRRVLHATDEENLAAIPRKRRAMIRAGERSGLQSRLETDGTAILHRLAAPTLQRLGSPSFPLGHYRSLRRQLGEDCEILTVWRDATPVAAVMSFFFAGSVMPYYAGLARDASSRGVSDFLYWELMRRARERGTGEFDFGRSRPGTGTQAYKEHWGFHGEVVRARMHSATGTSPSTSTGSGLGTARLLWSRLPSPVTRLLGPPLMKHLGVYHT